MTRAVAMAFVALAPLAACTFEQRTDRNREEPATSASEFLRPWGESVPPAGVRSGDLVWIWGMAGTVPGSLPPRLVEGGVAAETRQALDNIVDVLEAAGAVTRDVAQCSVFLVDTADLAAVNEVYTRYFPAPPLRSAVKLGGSPMDARVEIECTAVLPSGS